MNRFRSSRSLFAAMTTIVAAITLGAMFGPWRTTRWEQPGTLFALVLGAALVGIVAATVVLVLADRRELAEVGLLGSGLMAASVMPLVHGLAAPGVLYNDTAAFRTATFLTMPIAVAAATPLVFSQTSFGRWAARRWRDWSLLSLLAVFIVGAALVALPDLITVPGPRSMTTIVLSLAIVVALGAIANRQVRLFVVGQQPANLVAAVSLTLLAAAALAPVVVTEYSPAFWWLRVAAIVGVLGASAGLAFFKRFSRSTHDVLAPVLTRDPLVAFELGLSPIVHGFVSSLERKDAASRDHVVRTTETAIRVGEHFRLSPRALRDLGLAAMLHDIGKVALPDEIVQSTGRLTDGEYAAMKQHPVAGADMLLADKTLSSIAPIVRSHHERIDGRGYPDGLAGSEIPLAARIIAVCDAFDAMTNDRPYRKALSTGMALAVLNEHAGSQWDPAVIAQLVAVLPSLTSPVSEPVRVEPRLATFGGDDDAADFDYDELLAAVDAEI